MKGQFFRSTLISFDQQRSNLARCSRGERIVCKGSDTSQSKGAGPNAPQFWHGVHVGRGLFVRGQTRPNQQGQAPESCILVPLYQCPRGFKSAWEYNVRKERVLGVSHAVTYYTNASRGLSAISEFPANRHACLYFCYGVFTR